MALKIFFSWQVDTPPKEGRNLILRALEIAQASIAVDLSIEEALRDVEIDRDTLDVPGTPPIVDTIFQKIDKASIFIPDLTFVGLRKDGRPTPNPNVLIEYGWALKTLGHGRMLPVMNTAFGRPEGDSMPFDMRHLRHPIQFECAEGLDDEARSSARNKLAVSLKAAILSILSTHETKDNLKEAVKEVPFAAKTSLQGGGRFRAEGESLGISDDGIMSPARDVFLIGGPSHWLRVMPLHEQKKTWSLGELKKAAFSQKIILPISSSTGGGGFNYVRAEDGFGLYATLRERPNETMWAVFAFTTGEIWSADTYIVDVTGEREPKNIYLNRADLARSLTDYTECMMRLGMQPPVKWEIGIEGIKGRGIYLPNDAIPRPRGACVANEVVASGTFYPEDDAFATIEPFFSKVYDLCGLTTN